MTRLRENNNKNKVDDPVDYLLQKAKKEFFSGKISQAAYLWEKALEKAPDNEEALACRAYVRKNSIALRAVALGKDIKVPPPPVFLEREDERRGESSGARRFSSTEDLEWSDLEDESSQSRSVSQGEGAGAGDSQSESAESDVDEDSVLLPSLPELEDIPKPSTTLSGMPTSRLLPKDLFSADDVTFSGGGISVSGVDAHDEALDSHPDDDPNPEQTGIERNGMSVSKDPQEHVVKMTDRESEALLDPEKGLVYAWELFQSGEHAESLRISELLEDQLEGNEDIQDLIEQNREILEKFYIQRLGGLDSVPMVELGAGNLQDMDMDHKTAFLLTRIDGVLTIDDVMSIAGMSRLETAKMLLEAMEKGIIVIE